MTQYTAMTQFEHTRLEKDLLDLVDLEIRQMRRIGFVPVSRKDDASCRICGQRIDNAVAQYLRDRGIEGIKLKLCIPRAILES